MDRDELREALDRDELNYPRLAEQAGPESIDDLEALVAEDEPRIAPKAAYLAALIDAEGSDRVVALAARSRHDVVRASAAAALGSLSQDGAAEIADRLLADPDVGIRARTVKSVGSLGGDVQRSLRRVAEEDDDPAVRELAQEELGADYSDTVQAGPEGRVCTSVLVVVIVVHRLEIAGFPRRVVGVNSPHVCGCLRAGERSRR